MTDNSNILLITTDSLRADCVYSDRADTPSHDRIAKEGITFERAYSQGPFTTFSMPSLFTSRYPSGLEYVEFSDSTIGVYINDEPSITEALEKAGYHTAGFHSNPLLSNLFGFDRGFEAFDARLPLSNVDRFSGRAKILTDKLLRLVRKHAYLPAEKLNERAINWLDSRDSNRPFFLWLHYMDVHGPYQAKTGNDYINKFSGERLWRKALKRPKEISKDEHERLKNLYRAEVEYTDSCLGELFDALQSRSCFEDTITVLTADHGEQFYEHNQYSHPHQLYDELTHVPLIIRDSTGTQNGEQLRGENREDIVELIDVAPTLVEKAGGDVPKSFVGSSLLESQEDHSVAISEADITPHYNGSIRTERWRYVRNDTIDKELLFDHRNDPYEQRNVLTENTEVSDRLASRLDDHVTTKVRSVGPNREVAKKRIEDTEIRDRLDDLGYLS